MIQARIPIPADAIAAFCRKWQVRELSLFGSVLREDFGPESDIDVLLSFHDDAHPTLFSLAGMQIELEEMLGRRVDLTERESVEDSANPIRKRMILDSARVLYAA